VTDVVKLTQWERGLRVESRTDPNLFAFFWFYEWHLFDAVVKGEHTHGSRDWEWALDGNGTSARMDAGWLNLQVNAA
jgi:hypothetical protein